MRRLILVDSLEKFNFIMLGNMIQPVRNDNLSLDLLKRSPGDRKVPHEISSRVPALPSAMLDGIETAARLKLVGQAEEFFLWERFCYLVDPHHQVHRRLPGYQLLVMPEPLFSSLAPVLLTRHSPLATRHYRSTSPSTISRLPRIPTTSAMVWPRHIGSRAVRLMKLGLRTW